ncbi:MAG: phenylalanine--tRNA ligase subunit alpha [Actinomycetes bacterium]|jgi:phenylalanyl-tRNA synthetase alpha chain|nr:MAG: phenylalanine--tRNA ligase subunit alpha [Actinomycetota bacterium]
MDPLATLEEALASAAPKVGEAATVEDIDRIESALLGKESAVGQVRRAMAAIAPEDRPRVGARLNEVTTEIQRLIEARRAELQAAEDARRLAEDAIDVTLESVRMPAGSRHLIQQVIDEVVDIFVGLGYRVAEGPEAELAWYNFDALNTPKTHPSRLESDTMYLDWGNPEDEVLLRTQTSPVQARYMESHQPPVYIVAPGRTYRTDTVDATHLPVFHQIEGLAVDEGLTLGDLRGTLAHFAREFFGSGTQVRLRPSFFPFTEPSAELDVSCFACDGGEPGCRVCGGAGWLEMLGCGMVDPNVLSAAGYDPEVLSGFAFGVGVERLAMVRHGLDSIKNFIDNDIRFLRQFP